MRRVAVTGMGVISPVGNDRSSFWNNLIAGKNGIGLLTRFDTSEQKVKVAAQVEDFDPVQYMERAQVRKTDLQRRSRRCRMQGCVPTKIYSRSGWESMSVPAAAASTPSPNSAASFGRADQDTFLRF